ncbi:16018_t:CDS:2 [Cetraspora pellucida]|uniref:16018_t:CDS:1 n=1 Tax=Cetraspora pellucida TaxID=1433469 RepID=A0A9N8ZAH4_9GLOM|nr:16018_t:CDS:2 [Cetraspora pellucida]
MNDLAEVEFLIKNLHENSEIIVYFAINKTTNENFLNGIFWAYHISFTYFSKGHNVIIIDVIYKTNWFNMPLVVICFVDTYRSTYILALALISQETTAHYTWVLECFKMSLVNLTENETNLKSKLRNQYDDFIKKFMIITNYEEDIELIDQKINALLQNYLAATNYITSTWFIYQHY